MATASVEASALAAAEHDRVQARKAAIGSFVSVQQPMFTEFFGTEYRYSGALATRWRAWSAAASRPSSAWPW